MTVYDQSQIAAAWRQFILHQTTSEVINSGVANSWKRCWGRMNPFQVVEIKRLQADHLLATQVQGFDLISIARPVMEDIFQFIEGSDTVVILTNGAGVTLDLLGSPEMLEVVSRLGVAPGAMLTESEMGTNAFALCLYERTPAQVVGAEHYLQEMHDLAAAAAPIFDLSGRPMGAIGLVNFAYRYHPHTLGLAVAGARAVENQRQADYLLAEQHSQLARLNAILEASQDGILVWNSDSILMHINEAALRMLNLSKQNVLGHLRDDVIQVPDFLREAVSRREPVSGVETSLEIGGQRINCIVSLQYVTSGQALQWLIVTLREVKEVRELVRRQVGAQAPMTLDDMPGNSPAIQRIHRVVRVAAPARASVLILGESGTGKNVLASAIHNASPRWEGPFLIFGCSSIPHEWVVSELLGFDESVGSKRPGGRPSKFELAHGGTLFFQNVDDLPLDAQAILLNYLDLGIIQRLGSERPIQVDVRVIASSSADIEKMIGEGNFRSDLYYRLSSFEITLPPLRERLSDVPLLVARILQRISRQLGRELAIDPAAMELLKTYRWPGNVRELEAVIGRAAVQASPESLIRVEALPAQVVNYSTSSGGQAIQPLYQIERDTILQAAEACNGNVSEMARQLGVGRTTVWRRIKEMNLSLADYRYHKSHYK
jgi:transcriptional activator for dhaKLM operon